MQAMIERAVEDHSQWLHTITCATEPRIATCPICECQALDSDYRWRLAHPCGIAMKEEQAFICDNPQCERDWLVLNWDHIEEYEFEYGV